MTTQLQCLEALEVRSSRGQLNVNAKAVLWLVAVSPKRKRTNPGIAMTPLFFVFRGDLSSVSSAALSMQDHAITERGIGYRPAHLRRPGMQANATWQKSGGRVASLGLARMRDQ